MAAGLAALDVEGCALTLAATQAGVSEIAFRALRGQGSAPPPQTRDDADQIELGEDDHESEEGGGDQGADTGAVLAAIAAGAQVCLTRRRDGSATVVTVGGRGDHALTLNDVRAALAQNLVVLQDPDDVAATVALAPGQSQGRQMLPEAAPGRGAGTGVAVLASMMLGRPQRAVRGREKSRREGAGKKRRFDRW